MRIVILGAGAIGCLFGVRLHRSGQSVLLVHHRRSTVVHIEKHGVVFTEISGKILKAHIDVKQSLSKTDEPELILLTVKAYDTENAVRSIERTVGEGALVLSLQNGLGNIEILRRRLSRQRVLAGTTTEAALSTGPGRVIHTGKGTTWIGEIDQRQTERLYTIRQILRKAGFATNVSRNIQGKIWSKAIVNSAINPISALARVPNGEILRLPALRDVAKRVVDEGSRIAAAQGISLNASPRHLLRRVLSSTSSNKSSMLQDIEVARKTEIHQLNGRIGAIGKKLRLPSPYNGLLTTLVVGLEAFQENAKHSTTSH